MLRIVVATIALASAAPAAEAASLERQRHDMRLNLGLASAVGYFGYTYSYSPVKLLELEAGTGLGYTGLQLSLMPKLSLGSLRHRFIAGAGVSSGVDPRERVSFWLNTELGLAWRSSTRFSLLVAAGVTVGLGGQMEPFCPMGCSDDSRETLSTVRGRVGPQGRLAVGWWF